ncbi:TPA: hypothetical protein H7W20_004575 [Escherichia coli]|nr:hypothetical protein [Escherichia coli]
MVGRTGQNRDTSLQGTWSKRSAASLLLSQWELSAPSISFVRQDVEDTPIKEKHHARTRFLKPLIFFSLKTS